MRTFIIAAAGLAAAMIPMSGASAQYRGGGYYRHDPVRAEMRECRRELRHARNRWEYRRELAECRREIARARYERARHHRHRRHY
jgi:hypothetical protein